MEARKRPLPEYLQYDDVLREGKHLERLIVGPHCCGSERAVAGTQGRRADCCVEHAGRTSEDSCVPSGGALRPQREGDWIQKHTRRKSMASLRSLSTSLFHFLLSCVLLAEYAPISWHRAQRAFIPKGATAERCTVVTVVPRLVGQAGQRKQRTNLDGSNRILGALGIWMSGRETKEAAILEQQRCQWSAEKGGSDFRSEAARRHERIPVNEATMWANRQQVRWQSKRWTRNSLTNAFPWQL